MRKDAPPGLTQFVGVRLTEEELQRLDEVQRSRGLGTRSEAVRALVHDSGSPASAELPLPPSVVRELEEMVEDGWAREAGEALTLLATLGFQELSRLHSEGSSALRGAARASRERHQSRRKADREGRGLLGR
ncbi:MAG: ribbon-helix-helix domain-containing protein [Thermoplasmata archaeon]